MPDRIEIGFARVLLRSSEWVVALPFKLRKVDTQLTEERRFENYFWAICEVRVDDLPTFYYAFEFSRPKDRGYLSDPFDHLEEGDPQFVQVFPVYPVPVTKMEWHQRME